MKRCAPFFPGSCMSDVRAPLASIRITVRRLLPIAFANSVSVTIPSSMAQTYDMAQSCVNYHRPIFGQCHLCGLVLPDLGEAREEAERSEK